MGDEECCTQPCARIRHEARTRRLRTPFLLVPLLLTLSFLPGRAQDSLDLTAGYSREHVTGLRRGIAVGLVGAISLSIAVDSYYAWWQDANKPFSFYNDGLLDGAYLGIDKVGHMYGTYATFKIIRNILLWGGSDPKVALWWAAGIAAFHSLQIEIGDAISPWGFDLADMTMGFIGVGYGLLQAEIPSLRNFNLKVSYWSKTGFTSPANFTRDYDAMTVWLAADVHNLLPSSLKPYWPSFLQVAVGYGLGWGQTRREFAIGLDLNLEAFAPCNDNVLLVQRVFNTVHWPAPAIKLTDGKGPVYYGVHLK